MKCKYNDCSTVLDLYSAIRTGILLCCSGRVTCGRLWRFFSQVSHFYELIFVHLASGAAAAAGMASGGTSGKQAFFLCVCVVLNLCVPPAWMSWIHLYYLVVHVLPIPHSGMFNCLILSPYAHPSLVNCLILSPYAHPRLVVNVWWKHGCMKWPGGMWLAVLKLYVVMLMAVWTAKQCCLAWHQVAYMMLELNSSLFWMQSFVQILENLQVYIMLYHTMCLWREGFILPFFLFILTHCLLQASHYQRDKSIVSCFSACFLLELHQPFILFFFIMLWVCSTPFQHVMMRSYVSKPTHWLC